MRITVIGSTGGTGRHVLAEGLRRGHQMTAFTRRPQALLDTSGLAAVVTGDGRDPHAVRRAITDADAVIAIVSAKDRKGPHHAAAVAEVITGAMKDCGVDRLIVTSAYPIVARRPRLPMVLLRLLLADAYAEAARMEAIVAAGDLNWTIVRLNRLTNAAARGAVRLSRGQFGRPAALARADAANALLDIVTDEAMFRVAINAAGGTPPRRRPTRRSP